MEAELDSFQRQVAEKFIDLNASAGENNLLSLDWISKLLDSFLCCQEEFRAIIFNHRSQISAPPMDRILSDYFERSIKALDVCNAIRDGIEQIRQWRMKQDPLPRSKFADGVRYLRENWHALTVFLTDPEVPLDNSMAERAQRPAVLGRKIHLGSRSELGTRVGAAMYSLVQSARRVGVDPGDYLLAVVLVTLSDPRRQAVLLPHEYAAQLRDAAAAK